MKKDAIQLFTDESDGSQYWKKCIGEATKNHQGDSEDVKGEALILMEENEYGFNPGLYFNVFVHKLADGADNLFSRPIRAKKSFMLHENPDVWYETNKIGVKQVAKALPVLCEAAEIRRNTNHQLRTTHIELLAHNNVSDREIQSNSGHINHLSLNNYNKRPSRKRKIEMARIVSNGYKQGKTSDAARSKPPQNETKPGSSNNAAGGQITPVAEVGCEPSSSFNKEPDLAPEFVKELDVVMTQIEKKTSDSKDEESDLEPEFVEELDAVMTQIEKKNAYQKFIKNEQVLTAKKIQAFQNFSSRMEESDHKLQAFQCYTKEMEESE